MATFKFNEVRTLVVPIEAAIDAVLELDRSHGGRLAGARLMEARVEAGDNPCLVLVVRHATASAPKIELKRYELPAIAAAVIHYCTRLEVPLPRKSTKTISVVEQGFELKLASVKDVALLHGGVSQIPVSSDFDQLEVPLLQAAEAPAESITDTFHTLVAESELSEASAAVA